MQIYTKEALKGKFIENTKMGWIPNTRHGNHGGVGNTLEEPLGIEENNLPIPNTSEWELKAQRINSKSPTTLFHMEPSPRALRFVPKIFLPLYGWAHTEAGSKYGKEEMSFRQTIHGAAPSDRGFIVKIDRVAKKITISFDATKVAERHREWLKNVEERAGLGEILPQPYWGFDDLEHMAGTKLLNVFYAQANVKKENSKEFYKYSKVMMLESFSFEGFLKAIETSKVLVDFDARTKHNHGTKFRLRKAYLPTLYEKVTIVV